MDTSSPQPTEKPKAGIRKWITQHKVLSIVIGLVSIPVLFFVVVVLIAIVMVIVKGVPPETKKADTKTQTQVQTPTTKTTETPKQQTQPKAEFPKPDTSKLNATVKKAYDFPGIEITNNEEVTWDTCELKLNGSYERTLRNGLGPHEPLNNPYGLFTKSDGTRFNAETTTPKDFYVSCRVKGVERNNYFVF